VTPEFKSFYEACLATVQSLVEMDPDPATPEGKLLVSLAAALEEFEKAEFPSDRKAEHG
jgi:hypothetical protein